MDRECDVCQGVGNLDRCVDCGSTDIENTHEATGCEHERGDFDQIDCPGECNGTGRVEVEAED